MPPQVRGRPHDDGQQQPEVGCRTGQPTGTLDGMNGALRVRTVASGTSIERTIQTGNARRRSEICESRRRLSHSRHTSTILVELAPKQVEYGERRRLGGDVQVSARQKRHCERKSPRNADYQQAVRRR